MDAKVMRGTPKSPAFGEENICRHAKAAPKICDFGREEQLAKNNSRHGFGEAKICRRAGGAPKNCVLGREGQLPKSNTHHIGEAKACKRGSQKRRNSFYVEGGAAPKKVGGPRVMLRMLGSIIPIEHLDEKR